jgi:hypothetical protein
MKLPQLSLRDLFWLVALVATGCGWWVDRSAVKASQESRIRDLGRTIDEIANACQDAGYTVGLFPDGSVRLSPGNLP